MNAGIELTVRIGRFGEEVKTIALPIDESLLRELMEPMELSDESLSLALASPCMFGGKGDVVTTRKKKFSFRRDTAKYVGRLVEDAFYRVLGDNDTVNGYQKGDWSERDQRQAEYVRKENP